MVNFDDLLAQGTISRFLTTEKEKRTLYLEFHKESYKEDIATAKLLQDRSHRWSVTAAYYAMLNVTKLYLAKHHNLSINERSHLTTRIALEHVLKEEQAKKKAIGLLREAEAAFESFTPGSRQPTILSNMLGAAKQKREKASYYAYPPPQRRKEDLDSFFKSVVEPFLAILEGML